MVIKKQNFNNITKHVIFKENLNHAQSSDFNSLFNINIEFLPTWKTIQ